MKVLFTGPAKKALNDINERHRKKGYGKAGRKARAKVLTKTMLLKDYPQMGQVEEQLEELGQDHRS